MKKTTGYLRLTTLYSLGLLILGIGLIILGLPLWGTWIGESVEQALYTWMESGGGLAPAMTPALVSFLVMLSMVPVLASFSIGGMTALHYAVQLLEHPRCY